MRKYTQTFHTNEDYKLVVVAFIATSPFSNKNFVVRFSNVIGAKTRPCASLALLSI